MLMMFCTAPLLVVAAAESQNWLGLQVDYADRGYAFTPWPAVELRNVTVRSEPSIQAHRAWVTPDWGEWLTTFRTSRVKVHVDQITAQASGLKRLGRIDGKSSYKVSTLRFDKLKLMLGEGSIELPAGQMDFAADGTLSHISIALGEKVTLEASPAGDHMNILVRTAQLKWDALPAFLFDNVAAQGTLDDQQLLLDRIGATSDGGAVSGAVRLTIKDQYVLDADLKLTALRAKAFLARMYPHATLQGDLSGQVKIRGTGASFADIGKALSVSGTYSVKSGAIDRLGLLEGMRKVSAGPAGGGLTRFDSLDGSFNAVADKPATVTIRRLDAGALQASGGFVLNENRELRGNLSGSMRLPGGETSSRSFVLRGRVDSPSLEIQ
ncbi:MAG: AsmA-like C-terminal region-containing protein [Rhodocyclaceae bacterium]